MQCEYEHGCVRTATDSELMLCHLHMEQAETDAQDAQTERLVDAARDNGREYPRYYDGTGRW